ncbi:MAG TPA: prenyltransferase/squalene oxidase repeat-containing protein [Candidatus Thermoplasmatota archaeon]|nr:prenyltransferase/squalene oxidase repeat-containing protein [Candidatus Thermoplasmatota archaeon]
MRWSGVRCMVVLMMAASAFAGCTRPEPWPDLEAEADAAFASLLAGRGDDGRWPPAQVPYVIEAAHAAGKDLHAWPQPVPVAHQVAWPPENASLLQALRPLLAVALAAHDGVDVDVAASQRVQDRVMAAFDGRQFGDPALLNDDAFALIVLGAAHVTWSSALDPAVDGLLANQSADGGWSWSVGGAGETDMAGLVLAGVTEAGAIHRVDRRPVLAFLDTTRSPGGGHALHPGGPPNCDSTVWAIRAHDAFGMPAPRGDWDFLVSLQRPDGSFAYTPGGPGNALCTSEAATLLAMAQAHQVVVPPR